MVLALASAHTAAAARWVPVRPLADFQRRCQNGTLAGGGDPNRTKQKKWACGKSGEKESGFARLLRCRPAESDLARSARKSKKSHRAPVPPFKMSAGATLSPETRGLPERGLAVSMSWGRGTRVPLARPKALEQGNSGRNREGCDTKPLYYRKHGGRRPA